MRRVVAGLATGLALVAGALAFGGQPVAAVSPCGTTVTVTLNGPAQQCTIASSSDVTQNLEIAGAKAPNAVFDVRATGDGGQDFFLCLWGNQSTLNYARSSHVSNSTTQRVALSDPYWTKYSVELYTLAPNTNAVNVGLGFCQGSILSFLGSAQGYTLTVSYDSASATPATNGFAFSTRHLPDATTLSIQGTPGAGEPTIVDDANHGDRVYVSAPTGVPSGLNCIIAIPPNPSGACLGDDFWYSTDGGKTFTSCNAGGLTGGGDSHTAVDDTGSIYNVDLAASHVYTQKITSPNLPDATQTACNFQATQPTDFEADRQWIATYDPQHDTSAATVRVGYHDFSNGIPIDCESTDGGNTYPTCATELDPSNPQLIADATGNTVIGPQVFDSHGNDYEVFMTSTQPDNLASGNSGVEHNIYIATSSDGTSWTDYPVYQSTPYGTSGTRDVDQLFAVLAVDKADNLYVVWGEGNTCAAWNSVCPANVYLASSTDHGQHWTAPTQVNTSATKSNVLPWIVAGDDGKVDVAWVGSTTSENPSGDVTADWRVYMANSQNAHSSKPTFTESVVSPYPVRRGQICESGLNCSFNGDDGRILLDFISVALDSSCHARIAYANAGPDPETATRQALAPFTDYAQQTAGPTVCAAAAAKTVNPGTLGSGYSTAGVITGGALAAGGVLLLFAVGGLAWRRQQS